MEKKNKKNHATRRDVINFLATADHRALVNDHNQLDLDKVHPLTYSNDPKQHPEIHLIPMNYKFQRKFHERYRKLKKI